MDDSSFPTPVVSAFLSDDTVVVANYPVGYCSVDSKFGNLISSILKAMLRPIIALVILDDHNVRSWVLRVTFSFVGRSVDSG
jgi:hypothetical protein